MLRSSKLLPTGRPAQQVEPVKPLLRGWFHQVTFFLAIPAGLALVLVARGEVARLATAVYAVSLIALYGTSAAYHRISWSSRALGRMRRLDHSMIFVLIAGTYTPFSLLVLRGAWSVGVLSVVWTGAMAGIGLKLLRIDGLSAVSATLYIVLGWLAIVVAPQAVRGMSPTALTLLVSGGVLYTTGAVVLATRRPDPSPRIFGYHEVWHAFVVAATACHYTVIVLLTLAAR